MAQNVGAVPESRPQVPQDLDPYTGGTAVQSLRVINTLVMKNAGTPSLAAISRESLVMSAVV